MKENEIKIEEELLRLLLPRKVRQHNGEVMLKSEDTRKSIPGDLCEGEEPGGLSKKGRSLGESRKKMRLIRLESGRHLPQSFGIWLGERGRQAQGTRVKA